MKVETFANVWDALEDDPVIRENLKVRTQLLIALEKMIESWNLTQKDAAARLGITQPRLNDLLRGRIGKFSMDALVDLATKAGLGITLKIKKAA
ncbi:MAG TPA: XRE family transcriptional regulator [Rhizomicrobium sp.]|jgi:predicted XRE-type DNA-binding protein|nr:XRE family transcriptional regulator [Rhizomicrobium sp.]